MATWGWMTCSLLFGLMVGWFGYKAVEYFKNKNK